MPADDTATAPVPIILGYGDVAVQHGVTVARDGATLRIRATGHNLLLGLLQNEDRRTIEYVAETLAADLAPAVSRLST